MTLKICNFKRGMGDRKSKNYTNKLKIKTKQLQDGINCCYRTKIV